MANNHSNILKAKSREAEAERARGVALEKLENADYLLDEFDKPAETAAFYGFLPVKPLSITKEDRSRATSFSQPQTKSEKVSLPRSYFVPEEKVSLFRIYRDLGMEDLPHPIMLHYKKPRISGSPLSSKKKLSLAMIGSRAGISEILMIKTALAILSDHGIKNTYVEINCMGDKDSICKFEKEMSLYCRKNISSLPSEYRQCFRKDLFSILRCNDEKCQEFIENAPQSISSLSSQSIQHFKEILEYLETLQIPYKINNGLTGHKNYCPQIIFEIRQDSGGEKEDPLLAIGHRHNHFSRKIGFKREVPAISTDIIFNKAVKKTVIKRQPKPKFYFIQVGTQAKIKSLDVIENLRKAKVRISHSLTEDKLSNQMSMAERLKVSSIIIMGHKEAMEESVVVRDMESRIQETVPVSELAKYLKRM